MGEMGLGRLSADGPRGESARMRLSEGGGELGHMGKGCHGLFLAHLAVEARSMAVHGRLE